MGVRAVPGWGADVRGYRRESRTQSSYSHSRPSAGTCSTCGRFLPTAGGRSRGGGGGGRGGRRHPGAWAGEAGTIVVTIFFLRRRQQLGRLLQAQVRPACAWVFEGAVGGGGEAGVGPERVELAKLRRPAEEKRRRVGRGQRAGASLGAIISRRQCLLAKATAARAAAARRMPRPHGRRGDSHCGRRPTRAPDIQRC